MDKKRHTKDGAKHLHFKNLSPEFRANAYLLAIFIVASLLVVIFTQFIVIPILGGWDPLEEPIPTYGTLTEQRTTWEKRSVIVKVNDQGVVRSEGTAFVMETVTEGEKSSVYLVTAYHVVAMDTTQVYLVSDGKEYAAEVVDTVEGLDYALLKISGEHLFVEPRSAKISEIGEVGVYGNGEGDGFCSKRGYVSREEYEAGDKLCFEISSDFTTHTVLHGMSGSPVFTANGIVGMLVEGTEDGSMGYAVPYALIKNEYKRYRADKGYKPVEYSVDVDGDGNLSVTLAGGNVLSYKNGKLNISIDDKWESVVSIGASSVDSISEFLTYATDYTKLKQTFDNKTYATEFMLEIVTNKGTRSVKVR